MRCAAPLHEKLFAARRCDIPRLGRPRGGKSGQRFAGASRAVVKLARDPSPDVQLQVAIASRKIEGCDALPVLVDVLAHCGHDKLIPAIVWQNLHPLLETEAARFVELLRKATNGRASAPPAVATLLPRIVDRMLGAREPNIAAVAALI